MKTNPATKEAALSDYLAGNDGFNGLLFLDLHNDYHLFIPKK